MLSRTFCRNTRIVYCRILSLQIKHGRQLTPKLFHKSSIKHTKSYITKGAASTATLAAYLSTGIVPQQWLCGLFGGAMIGGSSVLMLAFHGRIAGISGIATNVMNSVFVLGRNKRALAACSQYGFFAGLLGSGIYWNWKNLKRNNGTGIQLPCAPNKVQPFQQLTYSPYIMAISGLLVGFGTRFGAGCTTGHGICGLGRRSMRSVSAVGTFFSMAVISATLINKYYPNLYKMDDKVFEYKILKQFSEYGLPIIVTMMLCGAMYAGMRGVGNENILSLLPSSLSGFGLGTGLVYSGMTRPDIIRSFLDLNTNNFAKHFDPTLGFVFVGALAMSVPLFPLVLRFMKRPILSKVWHLPTSTMIDMRLLVGSSMFGIGWGLSGICPGPGIVGIGSTEYGSPFYIFMLAFILGNRLVVLL